MTGPENFHLTVIWERDEMHHSLVLEFLGTVLSLALYEHPYFQAYDYKDEGSKCTKEEIIFWIHMKPLVRYLRLEFLFHHLDKLELSQIII